MQRHDRSNDRKAEAGSFRTRSPVGTAVEAFEHVGQLIGRNATALVDDLNLDRAVSGCIRVEPDLAPGWAMTNCVGYEIVDRALEKRPIGEEARVTAAGQCHRPVLRHCVEIDRDCVQLLADVDHRRHQGRL